MKYVFLAIAFFALFVSNPSIKDFEYFVYEQAKSRMQMGDDLAEAYAAGLTAAAIEYVFIEDYVIASKFTIDTAELRLLWPNLPLKVELLGIGGQFIPLTDIP